MQGCSRDITSSTAGNVRIYVQVYLEVPQCEILPLKNNKPLMLVLIFPLILLLLFIILRGKRKKEKIVFVGPRGAGKTRALFKICRDIDVKTVPTTKEYALKYRDVKIYEKPPRPSKDMQVKYGVEDKSAKYFFFINSIDDMYDFAGFDITFVYFGKKEAIHQCEIAKKVVFIDNEPRKLKKFI